MEFNMVVQGDYKNWHLKSKLNGDTYIHSPFGNDKIEIDFRNVDDIQILSENNDIKISSGISRLAKASIGGVLFGNIGAIVGATSFNPKSQTYINIMIVFKNGNKSIIKVDSDMYNKLINNCTNTGISKESENYSYIQKLSIISNDEM